MKAIIKTLLLVTFFLFALAIGAQNEAMVSINYLIAEYPIRLSWLMAILFLAGFLTCLICLFFIYTAGRLERRKLKQAIKQQQKQINQLQEESAKG